MQKRYKLAARVFVTKHTKVWQSHWVWGDFSSGGIAIALYAHLVSNLTIYPHYVFDSSAGEKRTSQSGRSCIVLMCQHIRFRIQVVQVICVVIMEDLV